MAHVTHGHGACHGAGCKGHAEPTSSGVSSTVSSASAGPLASPLTTPSDRVYAREWLYRLIMFPSYFTPCPNCCMGNRTPKREQLLTHFDTQCPMRVYCSHCPENKIRGPCLLQVRRSAFKDVIKASDIARFGCDISGVQQYTLNGSKVLYLNREAAPDRKATPTATAPATCVVDGRAMMEKASLYCSLKCKLHGEDPEFDGWLDLQDPAMKAAAYAAATAPPRPTAACKRASPNGCPYAYGAEGAAGEEGGGGGGDAAAPASSSGAASGASGRARKAPRNAATDTAGPAAAAAAAAAPLAPAKPRITLKGASSAPAAAAATAAPAAAPPPVPLGAGGRRFAPAAQQSAFLPTAVDGPVLGGGGGGASPLAASEWLSSGPLADLEQALSCSTEWGSDACAWGGAAAAAAAAGAVGDWTTGPAGSPAEVGDWWLHAAAPAPAVGGAAPGAAAPLRCGDGLDALGDDGAGLLVEWPCGGLAMGGGAGDLFSPYGMAASPGSEGATDLALCWD